ncbi:MAG: hypothetical protein ACK5IQ_00245 [Bacteroidales bacterium]
MVSFAMIVVLFIVSNIITLIVRAIYNSEKDKWLLPKQYWLIVLALMLLGGIISGMCYN